MINNPSSIDICQGLKRQSAALFFLLLGLFSIATGFPHPVFGHVSFDRVAQVMSVLILGPVDAAWIAGVASFLYPWHRLWRGVPSRRVALAALHNSGLMIFMVLGAGLLYQYLGGAFPPGTLDLGTGVLLLVLVKQPWNRFVEKIDPDQEVSYSFGMKCSRYFFSLICSSSSSIC